MGIHQNLHSQCSRGNGVDETEIVQCYHELPKIHLKFRLCSVQTARNDRNRIALETTICESQTLLLLLTCNKLRCNLFQSCKLCWYETLQQEQIHPVTQRPLISCLIYKCVFLLCMNCSLFGILSYKLVIIYGEKNQQLANKSFVFDVYRWESWHKFN